VRLDTERRHKNVAGQEGLEVDNGEGEGSGVEDLGREDLAHVYRSRRECAVIGEYLRGDIEGGELDDLLCRHD
jgi:hypothetical protein